MGEHPMAILNLAFWRRVSLTEPGSFGRLSPSTIRIGEGPRSLSALLDVLRTGNEENVRNESDLYALAKQDFVANTNFRYRYCSDTGMPSCIVGLKC
jgi:hypothetical protein